MPETTLDHAREEILTLHRKISALTEELTALNTVRTEQETQLTVALTDAYVGAGQEQTVATLQAAVASLSTQITEKERVGPILCERLQAARQVLRQIGAREHSEAITKIESRQEAIRGELAALGARQATLAHELEETEQAMRNHVSKRTHGTRRQATWRGPIEQFEALAADPFAEIRPDEVQRVVAAWREQEQQEGCRIRSVEVNYNIETGIIGRAIITDMLTRLQVRDLEIYQQDRARELQERERMRQAQLQAQ